MGRTGDEFVVKRGPVRAPRMPEAGTGTMKDVRVGEKPENLGEGDYRFECTRLVIFWRGFKKG